MVNVIKIVAWFIGYRYCPRCLWLCVTAKFGAHKLCCECEAEVYGVPPLHVNCRNK